MKSFTGTHPLIEEYGAIRAELARVESERDELRARIKKLDDLVSIQCTDGNWNYDPYMHGMANGMLVAQACMYDALAQFLDAPEQWLDSREGPVHPTEATP